MPKVIATVYKPYKYEVINPAIIGFDPTYGREAYFLIQVAVGNTGGPSFVVEADYEQEAIDIFVDSEYGHWVIIDEADVEDEENQDRAGNESKPINLDNTIIRHCEVDFGDLVPHPKNLEEWCEARIDVYNKTQAQREETRSPEQIMEFRLKALYDRMLTQAPPESRYGEWHMHHVNLEMVHTAIVIMDKLEFLELIYKEKPNAERE